MHPPAGGSRGIKVSVVLTTSPESLRRRDSLSLRRRLRTQATGVMLRLRPRLLALPPSVPPLLLLPLVLLLTAPLPPAASSPASCPTGSTWDSRLESCRACSRCLDSHAPFVVVPCQLHQDTKCGPLSAFAIDWSFVAGSRKAQQSARRPQGKDSGVRSPAFKGPRPPPARHHAPRLSSAAAPVSSAVSSPPRLPAPRKHSRPRTQEVAQGDRRGAAPEVAARLMDLEAPPETSGLSGGHLFLVPEGSSSGSPPPYGGAGEDFSRWGWRHWLAAGVSMAVVCALVLVLAPSALRSARKRCSWGSRHHCREKTKDHHNKIVKCDQKSVNNSSQNIGERRRGFHSSNHHALNLDEILASGQGSHRQETKNVYVPFGDKSRSPNSKYFCTFSNSVVLLSAASPGRGSSARVELQGKNKYRRSSTNCLRSDFASRTMFIGRSSEV